MPSESRTPAPTGVWVGYLARGSADDVQRLGDVDDLQGELRGAGLSSDLQESRVLGPAQGDDAELGERRAHLADRLDGIPALHGQVHEQDIRRGLADDLLQTVRVAQRADLLDVLLVLDEEAEERARVEIGR